MIVEYQVVRNKTDFLAYLAHRGGNTAYYQDGDIPYYLLSILLGGTNRRAERTFHQRAQRQAQRGAANAATQHVAAAERGNCIQPVGKVTAAHAG